MYKNLVKTLILFISIGNAAATYAAQILDVTIVDRKDSARNYTYVVPGYATSTTNANAGCNGYGNTINCNGSAYTTTVSTPGYAGSYEVQGTTLALKLPDGRTAIVNCVAKLNWTEWSNPNVYRSCRIPLVTKVQAEFNGDKAKLRWPVSIDGKKIQNETYKILGVLENQSSSPATATEPTTNQPVQKQESSSNNSEPETIKKD
jgi:hypothetical protein